MFNQLENALEQALTLKFPNIQGLEVKSFGRRKSTIVSFEKGEYSEQEVTQFLESLRKDLLESRNFPIPH